MFDDELVIVNRVTSMSDKAKLVQAATRRGAVRHVRGYTVGLRPLLLEARYPGVWRADRPGRAHGAGAGGGAGLDHVPGIQGGARSRPAGSRASCRAARHVPRLGARPSARRNARRVRVCWPLVPHGARALPSLRALRWTTVAAGALLRT